MQENDLLMLKKGQEKMLKKDRGISLKGLLGKVGGDTNFEFSTSNPMWRASLEILDFYLSTVDYSGGMIVTDWYSENRSNESIKITVPIFSK